MYKNRFEKGRVLLGDYSLDTEHVHMSGDCNIGLTADLTWLVLTRNKLNANILFLSSAGGGVTEGWRVAKPI
jgi:hypothetical protein